MDRFREHTLIPIPRMKSLTQPQYGINTVHREFTTLGPAVLTISFLFHPGAECVL